MKKTKQEKRLIRQRINEKREFNKRAKRKKYLYFKHTDLLSKYHLEKTKEKPIARVKKEEVLVEVLPKRKFSWWQKLKDIFILYEKRFLRHLRR